MSSTLHDRASSCRAFLAFFDSNKRFSKPVDLSTPSHR